MIVSFPTRDYTRGCREVSAVIFFENKNILPARKGENFFMSNIVNLVDWFRETPVPP